MRFHWLVALALVTMTGCTVLAPPKQVEAATRSDAPAACEPVVVRAGPGVGNTTFAQASVRNCGNTTLHIAPQVCGAGSLPITIQVRLLEPGRLPTTWGALTGHGDVAFPARAESGCPTYDVLDPGQALDATAEWNGTQVRDTCNPFGANASFTCPIWTTAPVGLYSFDARVWTIDGTLLEAHALVPRGASEQPKP